MRENPQPALVRVKAVRLVESRGRVARHVRPPDGGSRDAARRLQRALEIQNRPPLAARVAVDGRGRALVSALQARQGAVVSLAFFIVPVATVGSVAVAVAFFYAWRCWRDRKRRPVRPSALNIVGIEA